MGLSDRAYLVCETSSVGDGSDERIATFELSLDLESTSTLNKQYLVGNFGQRLDEARRLLDRPEDFSIDGDLEDRRVGLSVDAGAGEWEQSFSFEAGLEDVVWGDGSGGEGPENVTKFDASGKDVNPTTRYQILQYWLAKSRSDSFGNVVFHYGEWTTGSIPNVDDSGIEAGVYDSAVPVSVLDTEFRRGEDDVNSFNGTISMRRTQTFPDVRDELASIADSAESFQQSVADIFPDF